MAGLWEGVPASPCSAVSGDLSRQPQTHGRVNAEVVKMLQHASSPVSDTHTSSKRSLPPRSRDEVSSLCIKRSRSETKGPETTAGNDEVTTRHESVEFVEAKESTAQSPTVLVAQLNISASDERRKMLLQRLRSIDAKKAQLAVLSASHGDDEITIIESKSSAPRFQPRSPGDVQLTSNTRRKPRARKPRGPAKPRPLRGRKVLNMGTSSIIDVDADGGVPRKIPSAKSNACRPELRGGDDQPVVPVRSSARVRKPRGKQSTHDSELRTTTPNCMSKCRRFQYCKKLIVSMLRDANARPFSAPVNELWPEHAIPYYFDVITHPMDLRTVKKKLEMSGYISPSDGALLPYTFDVPRFVEDVQLIFKNAMIYNKSADMLFITAKSLAADFEKAINDLPSTPSVSERMDTPKNRHSVGRKPRKENPSLVESRRSKVVVDVDTQDEPDAGGMVHVAPATATGPVQDRWTAAVTSQGQCDQPTSLSTSEEELRERLEYLTRCRPAVIARQALPRGAGYLSQAALLYNVDMPYDQKVRVMGVIQEGRVPDAKLEVLVDLLRKATGESEQSTNDEVELNFEKLSNAGWRNAEAFLEQFVPGFESLRSSSLGREFKSVDEVDQEIAEIQSSLVEVAASSKRMPRRIADKPRSFFEAASGDVEESSSDSSGGESSDSDCSDSESEHD